MSVLHHQFAGYGRVILGVANVSKVVDILLTKNATGSLLEDEAVGADWMKLDAVRQGSSYAKIRRRKWMFRSTAASLCVSHVLQLLILHCFLSNNVKVIQEEVRMSSTNRTFVSPDLRLVRKSAPAK